jgi:hypothetical protein
MSSPSYLALTSTCRVLRHHALTTLQLDARRRVCDLDWAIPLPSEVKKATGSRIHMADVSNANADWLLYLSHVHRTPSMRARRWIYTLADALADSIREAKPNSAYADLPGRDGETSQPSTRRMEIRGYVEVMNECRMQINGMLVD